MAVGVFDEPFPGTPSAASLSGGMSRAHPVQPCLPHHSPARHENNNIAGAELNPS